MKEFATFTPELCNIIVNICNMNTNFFGKLTSQYSIKEICDLLLLSMALKYFKNITFQDIIKLYGTNVVTDFPAIT
jgi:hypothetical protein